jgi:hypothetical protein
MSFSMLAVQSPEEDTDRDECGDGEAERSK